MQAILLWKLAQIGADKDVELAELAAQTAANQAKAAVIAIPGVRWILFGLYAPIILHVAGIALGRMHLIEWDILDLLPWERDIAIDFDTLDDCLAAARFAVYERQDELLLVSCGKVGADE
jgi:hypothetical protein